MTNHEPNAEGAELLAPATKPTAERKPAYQPPLIITHSGEDLQRKAPAVNACGSYTEVDPV
jgi:hypothetical protein